MNKEEKRNIFKSCSLGGDSLKDVLKMAVNE